ncbi:16S rRNA (cytidine(1402)-2'-O)-methyltransferase [Alphaproteobacteria bacterium]|nr:16S rRNA (cytidine(1402)-2'-O)-methyltransferase [Alphaproteobacteria bacterium]
MKNGLYIVSTPIGNLGDISSRAIRTLGESDIIICENPKHSLKLLSKLDIKKKLISLHDYNEENVVEKIKDDLVNKKFSLISDAGSPLISDPGYKLVRYCVSNNIYITIVPGASSIISALQLSSIPINKYKFLGFVPKTKKGIGDFIDLLKHSTCTSVFFISTHKILLFLEMIGTTLPDRKIAVCKELTKINERVFAGPSVEVYNKFKERPKNSLGEFVIVVEEENSNKKDSLSRLTPDIVEIIYKLLGKFSLTDTVEIVHRIGNIGKKEIYKKALDIQNEK